MMENSLWKNNKPEGLVEMKMKNEKMISLIEIKEWWIKRENEHAKMAFIVFPFRSTVIVMSTSCPLKIENWNLKTKTLKNKKKLT